MTVVTKEIMRRAKGLIRSKGWARGDDHAFDADHKYGFCIATACTEACTLERVSTSHSEQMMHVFRAANAIDAKTSIGEWNDAPGRTRADVLAAFDNAIEESADQKVQSAQRHEIRKRQPRTLP